MNDIVALTATESERLGELEAVIDRGKQTFLEVGNALLAIREEKLYRPLTFEAYCDQRWGFSDRRARQFMAAAETGTRVPVSLPSERHARIVAAIPEEHQAKVAALIADRPVREAEEVARDYRERNGVGRIYNRHPRLVALAEELAGLSGRWDAEMCLELAPPQARKQLRAIETAMAVLEQAREAVEYRAATPHSWNGR
jgi:hypothetical protein